MLRTLCLVTTVAAVVLSFNSPVIAGSAIEDAKAALRSGDCATAMRLFQGLADQGDISAQMILVQMYISAKNLPEAAKWMRRAADQGNAEAQFYLGTAYAGGNGVQRDDAEAAKWYLRSANQGNLDAQLYLAEAYRDGQGVPKDEGEYVKWLNRSREGGRPVLLRAAANRGDAESQFELGVLYIEGKGVLQDYVQAHMWLNLAAVRGLERATRYRDDLVQKMTQVQIAEAQKLAREWKPDTRSQAQVTKAFMALHRHPCLRIDP